MEAIEQVTEAVSWHLAPPLASVPEDEKAADDSHGIPVISTPDELEAFIWERFAIKISKHACCPEKGHRSPWEAFCYAYFATGPVCIWKASRGFGGKSYLLSLLSTVEAITLRADVKILGGSGDQSKRVLHYTEQLWELPTAPRSVLEGDPGSRTTKLKWGNSIEALMASTKSVRGPHPQRLRLDEIDEMVLKVLNSAAGQTMSKGWVKSQTVMSSTHHYPQGTFTQKLQEAADKGWPVFEWCYRANLKSNGGWIEDDEIPRKQIEVPAQMWQVEYEGQEPSAEGRAFDTDAVKRMFEEPGALEETGVDGAVYGTGADWARKVDHTVITTWRRDVKPIRLAAIRRGQRKPWPVMLGWYAEQVEKFPGTRRHDQTGIGDVIDNYIPHASESDGVIFVGRDRQDLLTEYVNAVERGELVVPWPDIMDDSEAARAIRVMKKEHEYATVDDLYGKGKLPDTVASGALGYRAISGVIAAGAVRQPDEEEDGENEQQSGRRSVLNDPDGLKPGRLSGYMGIGRQRPVVQQRRETDEDDDGNKDR